MRRAIAGGTTAGGLAPRDETRQDETRRRKHGALLRGLCRTTHGPAGSRMPMQLPWRVTLLHTALRMALGGDGLGLLYPGREAPCTSGKVPKRNERKGHPSGVHRSEFCDGLVRQGRGRRIRFVSSRTMGTQDAWPFWRHRCGLVSAIFSFESRTSS